MPRAKSSMPKGRIMRMSTDAACSEGVPCSQKIQATITTSAIGTQCIPLLLISRSCQTEEEFPEMHAFPGPISEVDNIGGTENASDPKQQCETFPCQMCDMIFLSQKCHDWHRRHKHAEKPPGKHRCSQCAYSSNYSSSVTKHERTHTGERPFVCHLCRKGFIVKSNLRRHQLAVHAKERPHECEVCGQRFTDASHLASHRRDAHTPDRPLFTCPQCGKGFTLKGNLARHLLTHTGERPHACATCGTRFIRLGDMRTHKMVVHDRQYPHSCPHCGKGLWSVYHLRQHLRTQHWVEGKGAAMVGEQ